MSPQAFKEISDSDKVFQDTVFMEKNKHLASRWVRIGELYPGGWDQPLLPPEFSREQFGQGNHYECFMLTTLSTLVRFPDVIQNCFVSKNVRRDGRYTFQFFRGKEWEVVEIDDYIPLDEDEVLYMRSPTEHWWPLLLEKAYAKFYTGYENIEGCTLQEAYYDLTGKPVLNIPMDPKLAKAAGAEVTEGHYWLELAQKIQSGQFVASVLTRDMEIESMGLQREQQYGLLEVFSLTGTSSVQDIVVHLHNPFEDEEFAYRGPLNSKDSQWTPKLRAKYNVDDERSIFLPLNTFLKIINSMQLCYISPVEADATYFDDEWKGETAGGNPTSVTWRKNPLYYVRNTGPEPIHFVAMIKQEDQRRFTTIEEQAKYLQCGMVMVRNTSPNLIPTSFITGNNHKPVHKSLFLNSREVANDIVVPANSLCYLVPSCMMKGATGAFTLALYRMNGEDYSSLTVKKLSLAEMDWAHPAEQKVVLEMKEKDRVDFYVDQETDIHILMHQEKPFIGKTGGDAMTEDYMGMYLYDDTDRKIGGVHAATNFREIGVLHHLPRSGRYAISVTCPRAKGTVPAQITIVGSFGANVRIVDSPEDAVMFDDEDIIDEGDDAPTKGNPIDYTPINIPPAHITEVPDSTIPFEDKRFMVDNKFITNDPWIHIGDLYPEGKTLPLVPETLSREQFEQGEHFECCCLTAFATLVDHHPDVIRNAFVSKAVRKDGRYTFRFHRYGQWVKVEIDDRIPLTEGQTLFCRSPTRHWWPLLLEKAYAKFYTLYQNIEGCTLQEVYHDFTGQPVVSIPTNVKLAKSAMYDVDEPDFWLELNDSLKSTAAGGLTKVDEASALGLQEEQTYGILGIFSTANKGKLSLSDLLVMIYNPFVEAIYTGPMNPSDPNWTPELRSIFQPDRRDVVYMPVPVFCNVFVSMQQVHIKGLTQPSWHFNSEWGEGTNGGNPTLVTWRENPLYVVRNNSDEPLQIMALICQPDQRHMLHLLPEQKTRYSQCGLVLSQSTSNTQIPTYLVTGNSHRIVHKGLFLNSRESASLVTVPPRSLNYLVPSAMFRDKSKFLLSYWYQKPADAKQMKIVRLSLDVARHLPAIEHLELRNKEKDRVDFLVDVPTDIHILLRQEKPFKAPNGGDAMAEDFLGMYLYDGADRRIDGVTSATNYREMGVVHHLPEAGRYALSITCPRGNGLVPCKVEVVGVEPAHVRITDPPEDAVDLGEVDLAFLDAEPEGVPLEDLAIFDDEEAKAMLDKLKELHKDPERNAKEIAEMEAKINDRMHTLAKQLLGKDRPKYLPGRDLETLNPLLDTNPEYMQGESTRYALKKDPRNATKVRALEGELQRMADQIAEKESDPDLDFLDPEPEGIPIADIPLMADTAFAEMAKERMKLKQNAAPNASRISELEDAMNERAHELARQMHEKERTYLDPEPEGVPLDLLPLNEDEAFSKMEDELRALNRKPRNNAKGIAELQARLNDRAHELAKELKDTEREMFLDPQPGGVPLSELPLDTDEPFHTMEIERLRLRKDDPRRNADRIKELEDRMNERAEELAKMRLKNDRAFLDPEPLGFPLDELGLDYNDDFVNKEAELRELKKDPRRNAAAIKAAEEELAKMVYDIARKKAALDRKFLDPEPEGRLVGSLPLDDDKAFVAMDTKRRQMARNGGDPDKIKALEEEMNAAAHEMARALNAKERPEYLRPFPKGVPLEDLPLDADEKFRELEAKRQQLKRDPKRHAAALSDVEAALNARAEELAQKHLADDRAYLDPAPEGVPLRLLPLDTDGPFQALEEKRAKLKKNLQRNAKAVRDLEDDLNDRAAELAVELKQAEREKFLDPKPNGVPIADVPIDSDELFRDMEIQRLLLREDPVKNATAINNLEDAMNERALELAAKVLADERAFLDPAPLGIPLAELPLDSNEEFMAKEAQLRELRKDRGRNARAIAALEDDLKGLVRRIAAEELAKDREFLDPEPEGRLLEDLPLDTDKEFHAMEKERRLLKADPKKNAQKIADLEELMNERAHQLAKAMNIADRKKYLNPNPKGVPIEDLPLDDDEEFSKLEAKRAELIRNPEKNKNAIKDIEDALNLRAEELAQEKLHDERGFLEPEPQGIPLKYLPLDEDPEFHEKEVERMELKAQNLRQNDPKIKSLEDAMNDRANELAKEMRHKGRSGVLEPVTNGLPTKDLPLDEDMPFTDLEVEYLRAVGDGEDPSKARDLADAMLKRAEDVAAKVKADNRQLLEQNPLGIPLDELPLDTNSEFAQKEKELFLLNSDPKKNAKAIEDTIDALNDMAYEMAKEKVEQEREFLDPQPEGRHLDELPLNNDPTFLGLEKQRRELKKNPYTDEDRLADLEQMMNDRAHELAKKMNAQDRSEYLTNSTHGVPISELPLDNDREFAELEAVRAQLSHDPEKNAAKIAEVEDALNKRAEEMAIDAVRQDRMFLEDEVEGVPVHLLPLDDDREFTSLEAKRAALKSKDPNRNAKAISDLEEQMKDRAADLARALKNDIRSLLDQEPLGVPLKYLPLDDDERFAALEKSYIELADDPANKGKLREILDQLNDRAQEMAQAIHDEERALLDQNPQGVPLSSLPLNEDNIFSGLEAEARELRQGSGVRGRNAQRIKGLEDAMNARAAELANQQRKSFCDPAPEGIPLELLKLGENEEFLKMEERLRDLKKDPDANKEAISDLEFDLNNKAHEIARKMLEEDRKSLDPEPCGVPLSALPTNTDPAFHQLEVELAVLKANDRPGSAGKIKAIEQKLNERARVLAEEQKEEDLSGIDREPEGVPLSQLKPHEDELFSTMVNEIRELKKDPKKNADAIEDLREQMNDRAHELALEKLKGDRAFLEKSPGGVPLEDLPLNTDPVFHKLEAERSKLKERDPIRNKAKIHDLENSLNNRAHELAEERKKDELMALEQYPRGIPIELLKPHDDPKFAAMVNELRSMKKDPNTDSADIEDLTRQMNDRVDELAANVLEGDRGYLEKDPHGVPLELLPLSTDPDFHALEVERAVLKAQDPRRNAAKIADLENKLNERAAQLADEQRRNELDGLDEEPEGIPLSVLDPHSDKEFAQLVDQLRNHQGDRGLDDEIAALKSEMNERAHALAKQRKEGDRGFLDKEPQGVPLELLPLDTDPAFRQMEAERAKLRAQDPRLNARKIKDLEDALNNRVHELARDQLREDLAGVDELPRGIPLELLQPHNDPAFAALVDDIRVLKKDPEANADAIADVLNAMNDRVHELADALLDRGFLNADPEGVPLEILPLDTDPEFHALETERAKLKLSDPRRNAKKIKELEDDMNARVRELALQQLQDDLSGVDAAPEGIPLQLLRATEDAEFAAMIPQLRELKKNRDENADQIRNLEEKMNNRAYELADALLEGDRGYLDPCPLGVPLADLPLDRDEAFSEMEVERARLKAQDPRRNAAKIQDLEMKLNDRAVELAKEQLAEDLRGFPSQYEGIATAQLKPHDDKEFASLVPELRRLKQEGPESALQAHMAEMDRRLGELAKELVGGDLWFLDKEPEGVSLAHIPFEKDSEFEKLRRERAQLKAEDPRANADRIKDLEQAMNDRVHELARAVKEEDFSGLDKEPHGIPLELLSLREDPVAAKLIPLLRELRCHGDSPSAKKKLQDLQEKLNDRAQELALEALAGDRDKYLDSDPEGIPLSILPLDTDPQFHALEVERAKLKLEDPLGNAKRIEDLEDRLNERAHELARQQLQEDLSGLDPAPCGIPIEVVNPHSDAEFARAVANLRELKKDPRGNSKKIEGLKSMMNERAEKLARAMLDGNRDFLNPDPEGVPLSILPLDDDPTFHSKEVQRAVLVAEDPVKHAPEIAALEEEMNERAEELARDQLQEDLRGLVPNPRGVPLELLRPHADSKFASHLPELRRLKKDPKRNADAIRAVQDKMDGCTDALAEEFLRADRESYLDPAPLGVPLGALPLDTDPQFKDVEGKRLQLMLNPVDNKDAIAELEGALNARAHELAEDKLKNDRGYLDSHPEGVPLDVLPLDEDRKFHELEVKRAALKSKDPVRNAAAIKGLEDELNDRAHELALEQIAEDLRGVDAAPHGIPIELLKPHDDPKFAAMVNELRSMKKDPTTDPQALSSLEERMDERAHELAENVLKGCREKVDPEPEGIPLSALPLDDDKTFRQIELEMAKLKLADPVRNAAKIADLENRLNERAEEIARAVKAKDLEGLDQSPCGIPIALLKPHEDQTFASLANQMRGDGSKERGLPSEDDQEALNKRANELAGELLRGDRNYLDRDPEGIPLSLLPLDTDPDFHNMEVERAVLKLTDPKKNADKIADLEARLNDRAHELAKEQLKSDRDYLDPDPEGVPIADLPLDEDPKFHQMEVERAKLKARDAVGNAYRIRDLEDKLNERAHELAKKQLEEDLVGIDKEPEGVPLGLLNLHADAECASLIPELRQLKKDPTRNAAKIKGLQDKINDRAHELAKEVIAEGRKFLDPEPEGVPLAMLPLDTDKKFSSMEKELRALKAAPGRNDATIEQLKDRLNDRAHGLAREKIQGERGFLHPMPEGIPLADLPLDTDSTFRSMEAERIKLKEDPVRNADAIRKLEDDLNELAHDLAKELKKANRGFLNATSYGIPKELLPLDEDRSFQSMEQQRRKLKRDSHRNAAEIERLEKMMQDRADELGLQMLKGERSSYVDSEYKGVELVDIPLDSDAIFTELELNRAILKSNGAEEDSDVVSDMNQQLRLRAAELARLVAEESRIFLDKFSGFIPIEDMDLDDDKKFQSLMKDLRKLKRDPESNKGRIVQQEEAVASYFKDLSKSAMKEILDCLKPTYRGIEVADLNLHENEKFCKLATNVRRRRRRQGKTDPVEIVMLEDELDKCVCEIADDVINNERAFLDPKPEGMYLADVPLDTDEAFLAMEAERRKRTKDPLICKRNRGVIKELEDNMNDRARKLAREEFAKMRGFMDQEPEGIPLDEIGLDNDPEFKNAEVARYRLLNDTHKHQPEVARLEKVMNDRAHELANVLLANDRAFLDPEPEGVPLSELPLDTDKEFKELAMQRRKLKGDVKVDGNTDNLRSIEQLMNERIHLLAKDFLDDNRLFLDPEPLGILLKELPLNNDKGFREMEKERMKLLKNSSSNPSSISKLEDALQKRAFEIAKKMHKRERAFLDPEPLGVLLDDLPLNTNEELKKLEQLRRFLSIDPKKNVKDLSACEDAIVAQVKEIAKKFIDEERAFLDPYPAGVALKYLPLNSDRKFREMELERRKMRRKPLNSNETFIVSQLEKEMNDRARYLSEELIKKSRAFLDPEPLGVPLEDIPLNNDSKFRKIDELLRELMYDPQENDASVGELQLQLKNRATELAEILLQDERSFLDPSPFGIPLEELALNTNKPLRDIERIRRKKRAAHIDDSEEEKKMAECVLEIAKKELSRGRGFLLENPWEVSLDDLPLDDDDIFHKLELERRALKRNPASNVEDVKELEDFLNDRVFQLAAEYVEKEREFLDKEPSGVPLSELDLDNDEVFHSMEMERRQLRKNPEKNAAKILDLEDRLNKRVNLLALDYRGWQDVEFHEANKDVAEEWPRICELYPEGRYLPLEPVKFTANDVCSSEANGSYLAPFLAALGRLPPLMHQLIYSKNHPVNEPYSFLFFDPDSNPVRVDIDDRIPCDSNMEPKFTRVPHRSWYPLLLEKAYAKFVGGYSKLDQCAPHETLRDLTGRPVFHIPFDERLAEAANTGDYKSADFWREVARNLEQGDVITCMSNVECVDGIHPQCSYALLRVINTVMESNDPDDVIIKLQNSYYDKPLYDGPLNQHDPNWTADLKRVCNFDPEHKEYLYLPLPTFLRNFSSMQRCQIACGDRLSCHGSWGKYTSGGNPKFTTFRNNPIYLVENKTSRPVTILAELRHHTPAFTDPDGLNHYHQTGLVLMQAFQAKMPLSPLITSTTHKFLQKGMMLDAREVCSQMELPPSSTCYLIPYTMKRGCYGKFSISIYPGMAKVTLTPLRNAGLTNKPLISELLLINYGEYEQAVDFQISEPCDVHLLLRQTKPSDDVGRRGDRMADDAVRMRVFDEHGIRMTFTEFTNAREQALVFCAPRAGLYTVYVECGLSAARGGECPCELSIYTPRRVQARLGGAPHATATAGKCRLPQIRSSLAPSTIGGALTPHTPRTPRTSFHSSQQRSSTTPGRSENIAWGQ
ncbi:putative antigen [Trypanosoma theileri]|uniref:Putative antigen n=1 Tax=Trypanosoma theileri TaxID=67003 RepID=A0A1X0P3X6_9TRYP|nr:putative antigen [Trypanosoma theileri]ORC91634.1 putative antigen [Trypanosoma theileri]